MFTPSAFAVEGTSTPTRAKPKSRASGTPAAALELQWILLPELKFWVLVRGRHHFSGNRFSLPRLDGFELGDRLVTGQNHHLPTAVSSLRAWSFATLGSSGSLTRKTMPSTYP